MAPALSSSTPTTSKFNLLELGALPAATNECLRRYIDFRRTHINSHEIKFGQHILLSHYQKRKKTWLDTVNVY